MHKEAIQNNEAQRRARWLRLDCLLHWGDRVGGFDNFRVANIFGGELEAREQIAGTEFLRAASVIGLKSSLVDDVP